VSGARPGELVSAEVVRDRGRGLIEARIVERLGPLGDQRNISLIAIHQHGIPDRFAKEALAEAEALEPFEARGVVDLTRLPLVTIDPVDARDHDDAVFAEPDEDKANPGGFVVYVAIADVARYVRPGTALDREARIRGNSVYFPDRVVPMLPERISNDMCSLKAGEVRPAIACRMVFDAKGNRRSHRFERAAMRSAASLTYEQAQAAIDGRPDDVTGPLMARVLKPLWSAHDALMGARRRRSPLELDLPERKLVLDAHGLIERVVTPERLEAHRLIEEMMIQANVSAAETLEAKTSPLVYRIHEAPARDKVEALAEFLATVGISLPKGQVLKPSHFNRILSQVAGRDDEQLVNEVVLRTQAQAVYSPENRGHFGLNLRRYAHFTSPIRRYADLIVHRALISALGFGRDGLSEGDVARLRETADIISSAERRAMAAERDTVDRLIASHLATQTGAVFPGRIAGVTGSGLFVRLAETGADGFIPMSTLPGRFVYDGVRHALVGALSGETFQLGDRVEVRLVEVTPIAGGLRFEMVSEGRKGAAPVPRRWHAKPHARRARRH
jgi:ribonuclease R